ncbi:MAG: antitoxin [Christensenellaceae bacterium]
MGKTSSVVKDRYNKKAYDSLLTRVPKGTKELFRAACERNRETMNGVLNKFIKAYIEEHEGD